MVCVLGELFASSKHSPRGVGADLASCARPLTPYEPLRLVLNPGSNRGKRDCVLPVVMSAEQQLLMAAKKDPNVGLSATAVAAVHGVYQCAGGWSAAGRRRLALGTLALTFDP